VAFGERFDVAVGDVSLAGERWPADAPTVVLLHAGVCDRRCWYEVADRLDGRANLVAYDRRGYGDTKPGGTGYRDADDLAAVLGALGLGPVTIVGNSMGGGIALDFALTAPDRVDALLLIAPAVSGAPEFEMVDSATMVLSEMIGRAEADEDRDQLVRLETWLWLDGPGTPEGRVGGLARRIAEEMNRQILSHAAADRGGASGLDTWSRLADITAPTIVTAGELDIPVLVERSRIVSEQLADGVFRELAGTAHLPSLDQPDLVADLVLEVIGR
jgi:pimeloyl-ACP methyl ester carboxylesterase